MMETLPSGTLLNGYYRVERALGSGGFGHVYLTVDLRTNQQYAIKEYLVTGSSGQAQLEHEARVLSRLHHANLPAFQEAFSELGRYFVVLSYIEGSDLTDYIRAARRSEEVIPIARIMSWIISMCDAVLFLHNQHPPVIHRDIKPDNIRITPQGTAVLVDLGNAKATADGARTLFFIRHQGTPGYAPPEQYPGGTGTDVRSDIYALGGTLYFALTTQEPPSVSARNQSLQNNQPDCQSLQERVANNPPEESAEAKAGRQFRLGISKPAKPVTRHSRQVAQLGQLPPELLNQLNHIIKRAMAMKPKDRYQSIAELSNDLRSVMAALPAQQPSVHPVNPYSTQPDLPLLYDTIQAAKENKEPGSPATQPSSTPTSPAHCPRCKTVLTPQAAFCPRCGLALSTVSKANPASRPPAEPDSNTSNPSVQNKVSVHDISTEQTMVITPYASNRGAGDDAARRMPVEGHGPMSSTPKLAEPPSRIAASPTSAPISQDTSHSPPTPFMQNISPTRGNTKAPLVLTAKATRAKPTEDDHKGLLSYIATNLGIQPGTAIIVTAVLTGVLLIALVLIVVAVHRGI